MNPELKCDPDFANAPSIPIVEGKERLNPRIIVYIDPTADFNNPYDPSRCALEVAIDLAHGSEVFMMSVLKVPRNLPVDAEMPEETERLDHLLEDAEKIANSKEIKTRGIILKTRLTGVTHAIVDEASGLNADVIVVGIERVKEVIDDRSTISLDSLRRRATSRIIIVQPALAQK